MLIQFYIPKKIISINIDIEYNNPNIIIIKLFLYNKTYTNFNPSSSHKNKKCQMDYQ